MLSLVSAAILWTHRDELWDPELSSLNPVTIEDRALDGELRAALGASDARTMIAVHGATADEAHQSFVGHFEALGDSPMLAMAMRLSVPSHVPVNKTGGL